MDDSGFSLEPFCTSSEDGLAEAPPPAGAPLRASPAVEPQFRPELIRLAKRIKAFRGGRNALLDASLFGEPAWDMLLALYIAAGERYALSISALCAESGSPASTAARSINRLLELGMVRRVPNPSDNRSAYIELTDETAAKVGALLATARGRLLAG